MDQIYVEVITSPNCPYSPKAVRIATQVADSLKGVLLREVSVASNDGLERAMEYAIEATPAIAINGRLAFVGVPSLKSLKEELNKIRENEKDRSSYFF